VKKNWVAFKIKKILADIIKIIIRASPLEHSARQKLFSLKLIHKIIMMKNQEFNRYVENNLMQRFSLLARFNGRAQNKDNELDHSSNSMKHTASELMVRGENIFGVQEKDTKTSATFLIILLNCIEKWSQIEYG